MFPMAMPDVPPQYTQMIVAQAPQPEQGAKKPDRVIGFCGLVENPIRKVNQQYSAVNSVDPTGAAQVYFESVEHRDIRGPGLVAVSRNPQHGSLEPATSEANDRTYVYLPKPGYLGSDRATFLVELSGRKIRVEYFFRVMESVPEAEHNDKRLCPRGLVWKISSLDHPIRGEFASHTRYTASDSGRPVGLVGFPATIDQAQAT
jgi:hypothetical protein